MRIHNIYVDDAGETHWRDVEVQWVEERNGSKLSARLPATGIIFRETAGDYDLSWHPAPRRSPRATERHGKSAPARLSWSKMFAARVICRSRLAAKCVIPFSCRSNSTSGPCGRLVPLSTSLPGSSGPPVAALCWFRWPRRAGHDGVGKAPVIYQG